MHNKSVSIILYTVPAGKNYIKYSFLLLVPWLVVLYENLVSFWFLLSYGCPCKEVNET